MHPLNLFNPSDWADRFVQEFASCPSVKALFTYCDQQKPIQIHCTTFTYVRINLFVPQQKLFGLLYCHQINSKRYAAVKVITSPKDGEEYWLVVDSINRHGYLLPIDAFVEAESEILLPQSTELRAFA